MKESKKSHRGLHFLGTYIFLYNGRVPQAKKIQHKQHIQSLKI